MRKCFMCGGEVFWSADYDFGDFGCEGNGVVHRYRCAECGAIHEVYEEIEEEQCKSKYADSADGL